jgi:hypothetical protein
VKLLTETSLDKGNIIKSIPRDEYIIYIKKNKSTATRGSVNEKSKIVLTSNKPNSSDNRGEALKPSTRGLLEAVEVILWHFHRHCFKSSPLWFVVGRTKALVCSS